jgi:hypothetical protein
MEEVYTLQQVPWWIWYSLAGLMVLFRSLSVRFWSFSNHPVFFIAILFAVVTFWPIAIIIWFIINRNRFG